VAATFNPLVDGSNPSRPTSITPIRRWILILVRDLVPVWCPFVAGSFHRVTHRTSILARNLTARSKGWSFDTRTSCRHGSIWTSTASCAICARTVGSQSWRGCWRWITTCVRRAGRPSLKANDPTTCSEHSSQTCRHSSQAPGRRFVPPPMPGCAGLACAHWPRPLLPFLPQRCGSRLKGVSVAWRMSAWALDTGW